MRFRLDRRESFYFLFLLTIMVFLQRKIGAEQIVSLSSAGNVPFAVDWYTIDGGGGGVMGDNFKLSTSFGQFDAGTSSSATFAVRGGFQVGERENPIFSSGFETGDLSDWPVATDNQTRDSNQNQEEREGNE